MICAGGGGIPTMYDPDAERTLVGVEAVIDKDLASELLAREVDADLLRDGDRRRRRLRRLGHAGATQAGAGHARASCERMDFAAGSMGPKVEAAIRFVERTGQAVRRSASLEEIETDRGRRGGDPGGAAGEHVRRRSRR